MTDMLTLQNRLAEAESARHQLLTGTREVTVSLQGLGSTTYTPATAAVLDKYIGELRGQIAKLSGGPRRGPILVKF
jgi:ABC-type phosphate transport system substrate-binding protein